MKLKVIAQYKDGKPSDLTLYKERIIVKNGEVFEIDDNERANEILNATFHGKPVVEVVKEEATIQDNNNQNVKDNEIVSNNVDAVKLTDLTVKELQELAAQEGVELTATKKDDIIAEIETARVNKKDKQDNDKQDGENTKDNDNNEEGNNEQDN